MYSHIFKTNSFLFRAAVVVVITLAVSTFTTSAFASPVQDKQRKAARIAAEIEKNGEKISALAESYNATRIELANLKQSVTEAQTQLEAAEKQNEEVQKRVRLRAITMYTASSEEAAQDESPINTIRRDRYADIATGSDAETMRQLEITKETVNKQKATLEARLADIEAEEARLAQQKREIESANAAQNALLKQTKGELAALVAQQRERAARRAAATPRASAPSKGANISMPGNLPAPSPKAAVAIAYARQQLGKPYRYAATGPDSFDCSGLTMRAWGAAGVSMPHFSGAQINMFPQVPLNALEPGDLVFRPGHIGLYIGNGLMIHAPQTGDVVKVASMGRITKAARPG